MREGERVYKWSIYPTPGYTLSRFLANLLIISETMKTNFEPAATVAVEWPWSRIVLFSDFNGCSISDSLKYQPVVHTCMPTYLET